MNDAYSISDLSKEFGVSTRTIRFYEDKGLLKPRRDGQKRIFSAADKTRLKLILRGKRIGLSLDESFEIIQLYHHNPDSSAQLNKLLLTIKEQKAAIKKKKSALMDMEKEIKDVEKKCLDALKALEKTSKTNP